MIFDTHAHYDSEQFDEDRETLIRQAVADGANTRRGYDRQCGSIL